MRNSECFDRRVRSAPLIGRRGVLLALQSVAFGVPLLVAMLVSIVLLPVGGIGFVTLPILLTGVRAVADRQRRWAAEWSGVEIESPYRPLAPADSFRRSARLLADPATWRDLVWLAANIPVGAVLGLLPAGLLLHGVAALVEVPGVWWFFGALPIPLVAAVALGLILCLLGVVAGPDILRIQAQFSASLLAPTRAATAARVAHLTETRAAASDHSAAELRRIERDLHDGVQARLVALGLSIGLAEELVREEPERALSLLAEARAASGVALSDLRGLVRGIHPPVLAERGLVGAVRALALTLPLPIDVGASLEGRLPDPIESAAYFAIAEVLANIVKHSGAQRAWIELSQTGDRLVAAVGDDGVGGAVVADGGGLHGIERRIAVFDGIVAVTSPPGGPTIVTLEIPCASSSVRT